MIGIVSSISCSQQEGDQRASTSSGTWGSARIKPHGTWVTKIALPLPRNYKLGGIVEVDETFVGGLAKNRHWDKRGGGGGTGGIGSGKTPIVGAVSRKGNAVAA